MFESYEVSNRGRVRSWNGTGRTPKRRAQPVILSGDRVLLVRGGVRRAATVRSLMLAAFPEMPAPVPVKRKGRPRAKLTEADVRAIRRLRAEAPYLRPEDLAARFRISRAAVYNVISGRSWPDVTS